MPQDLENILRKSLDEADHARKRFRLVFLVLFVAVQAGLVWLARLSPTAGVKTMLICSVAVVLVGQVATAVVSWSVVAAMTRKTLKAIELLSKERPQANQAVTGLSRRGARGLGPSAASLRASWRPQKMR